MLGVRKSAAGVALTLGLVGLAPALCAQKVTVTVMAGDNERGDQWHKEMIAAFEASHPDIEIKEISISGSGLVNKMEVMIAAGTPPDIGYMDPWYAIDWAKSGILQDLTPYINAAGDQYADWYDAAWNFSSIDGRIYSLPQDLQVGAIFYNKDHYDQAGLAYPSPDWTYQDLLQNAKRLTVIGADGQVSRYGFRLPTSRNWVPIIWAFGGDLLDDWTSPTRFTGDNDKVAAALGYLHDLVQLQAVQDKQTYGRMGTGSSFTSRNVSMILTNSFVINTFSQDRSTLNFGWDVAPFPQGPAGFAPYINARGWFMFSGSDHPKETWEVLRYFTTKDALRRRVRVIGNMPPSRDVVLNDWLPSRTKPEGRALLLNDIEQARSPWPLNGKIFSPIQKEAYAAVWGDKSVQNALATMKQQVNGLLQSMASTAQ